MHAELMQDAPMLNSLPESVALYQLHIGSMLGLCTTSAALRSQLFRRIHDLQDGTVLVQAAVARVLLGQPQAALDLIVPSAEGPRCVAHRA